MTQLQDYFQNVLGAHLLPLSHDEYIPGAIIDTDWPFLGFGDPTFKSFEGMAWDALHISGSAYTSSMHQAASSPVRLKGVSASTVTVLSRRSASI